MAELQEEYENIVLDVLYSFLDRVKSQKDLVKKRKLVKEYITFMNNIVRLTLEASLDESVPSLRSASGGIQYSSTESVNTSINTLSPLPLSERYIKIVLSIRNSFEGIYLAACKIFL